MGAYAPSYYLGGEGELEDGHASDTGATLWQRRLLPPPDPLLIFVFQFFTIWVILGNDG